MIVKIIWTLVALNTLALILLIGYFIADTSGRNVDSIEKGWSVIFLIIALLVIFLAIVPMRLSDSAIALYTSLFFAALPLIIASGVFISNHLPVSRKTQTMAELYYDNKIQRAIASSIEQNDLVKLKELIKGQDLNIQGNRVWDWDGLNYLQFAVRLRSNAGLQQNTAESDAIIRFLVKQGSATTPALAEAIKYLSPEMITLLLDAGADPNTRSFVSNDALLFQAIGQSKEQNDMAILLIKRGANVNAVNDNGFTPLMYCANNAGTSLYWNDVWRVVRFLLEEAHADYRYQTTDGRSFATAMNDIRVNAARDKITMAPDFYVVEKWLDDHLKGWH